jgi:hypothetical protein
MDSSQILQWAALLCDLCKYSVEDSGINGAEVGDVSVIGMMVTSMAI